LEATDLELLRSAAGGDERAFHTLIDRHAGVMFRAALSLTRNRSDAEDLMQETFVGAYRGLKNFAGRSSVKTWLMQILTRQAAKAWHRNRHQRSALSLYESDSPTHRDDASLKTRSADAAVESKLDVMAVLEQLTEAHREILVLREVRQLSYDEIAEVLDVPRGTVESRLSRARTEFRQKLIGEES
jgi:RNA polymerase sigma-70 factor (ECF subfamily)